MKATKQQTHLGRDYYVERIKEILARGPAARPEICAELELNYSTASLYLGYMHKTLRIIHRGPTSSSGKFKWEIGAEEFIVETGTRRTIPARQVGMVRDALVAALFGPAQGVATC